MPLLCFRSVFSPDGRSCGWQVYLRQVRPYGASRRCDIHVSLPQMFGVSARTNGQVSGSVCRGRDEDHSQCWAFRCLLNVLDMEMGLDSGYVFEPAWTWTIWLRTA
jgi:hypothetical protein